MEYLREERCTYPIEMFLMEIYAFDVDINKKKGKAYAQLAKKRNPIEYLYQKYLNDPQKAAFEAEAEQIIDLVILTMTEKTEKDFFEREISENLAFYFECEENDAGKKEWYYAFIDIKTDKSLHHNSCTAELLTKDLFEELSLIMFLCHFLA